MLHCSNLFSQFCASTPLLFTSRLEVSDDAFQFGARVNETSKFSLRILTSDRGSG